MNKVKISSYKLFAVSFVLLWFAPSSLAHSFGERYDLPLPLTLYLWSAGLVVLLSFVIAALFIRHNKLSQFNKELVFPNTSADSKLAKILSFAVRLLGLLLFFLVIATGIWGNQNTFDNFTPTFIWVIWWVGFTFFCALIGNLWPLINPWATLARWSQLFPKKNQRVYPAKLAVWPLVVLFFIFAWQELIAFESEKPINTVVLIGIYSIYCWLGMAYYGIAQWLRNAELFSFLFSLLGRFAPFSYNHKGLIIRLPGVGLAQSQPLHFSKTVFVILLLSTVSFDGLLETPAWQNLLAYISENQTLRSLLLWLQGQGFDLMSLIKTIALILVPLLLLTIFMLFCYLSVLFGGKKIALSEAAGHYILSLVPIALAYHIAHYISYLLIAGQQIIPLASDPFGFGWDLFGQANYHTDIGVINAKMVWYVSVISIVVGHVIAVFLAHHKAIQLYQSRSQALKSQLPMLVLMIVYTMLSLWILSQPIVE